MAYRKTPKATPRLPGARADVVIDPRGPAEPMTPSPHYAAQIWLADETLWLGFPPAPGHSRGHCAHFPATATGMQLLLLTLREREKARASAQALKIATPAAPHQAVLDAMLAAMENRPINTSASRYAEAQAKEAERKQAREANIEAQRLRKLSATDLAEELGL